MNTGKPNPHSVYVKRQLLSISFVLCEFPGGLVVRIPGFPCHDPGSIPGQGTEIPQATINIRGIYIFSN